MFSDSSTPRRRIAILGSTGSIGTQALEVIAESGGVLVPVLLTCGRRVAPILEQASEFGPERIVVIDPDEAHLLEDAGSDEISVMTGEDTQVKSIAQMNLDLVLNGITGAAGLRASLATLEAGIDLALANKESLVTAGVLLRRAAEKSGARIIPVDSEHGAISQCTSGSSRESIQRIILTASGGPFRGMTRDQLATVTPEEALRHPTWKMGPRISIDSATLFNKLLEVVEAQELFGMPRGGIEVVIHPQSIVHAIVEFQDGSSLAHMGEPDMKVPIRDALHRGQRAPGRFRPLDLIGHGALSFEAIDGSAFPAMEIGKVVLDNPGTTLGAVLNAADEEAVAAFLSGSVGFLQIYELVERALAEHQPRPVESLEQVIEADHVTREQVRSWNP